MEIEATSPEEAKKLFESNVIMTAGMADLDDDQFCVGEDSISDIEHIIVEKLK